MNRRRNKNCRTQAKAYATETAGHTYTSADVVVQHVIRKEKVYYEMYKVNNDSPYLIVCQKGFGGFYLPLKSLTHFAL